MAEPSSSKASTSSPCRKRVKTSPPVKLDVWAVGESATGKWTLTEKCLLDAGLESLLPKIVGRTVKESDLSSDEHERLVNAIGCMDAECDQICGPLSFSDDSDAEPCEGHMRAQNISLYMSEEEMKEDPLYEDDDDESD
nr:hypothetical protein TetV2_00496 [Oceanusvirus sp.]